MIAFALPRSHHVEVLSMTLKDNKKSPIHQDKRYLQMGSTIKRRRKCIIVAGPLYREVKFDYALNN